jgi:uncharacterized membrane protein
MPDTGWLHPQVVHFVVALGLVGVLLRLVSLTGRMAWTNSAAALLLIVAGGASVLAVKSGKDSLGQSERIPGAREAAQTHEEWGKRTRTVLLVVGGLEILGLIAAARPMGRPIRPLAAAAGIAAAFCIVKVADLGGDLVYNYAGGVGTREGSAADLNQLLVAGLYNTAHSARNAGRSEEAAHFTDELVKRLPSDTSVMFLAIESKIEDRKDPAGALADLAQLQVPPDNPGLATRHGILTAQALAASGRADSAKALLGALAQKFPRSQGVKDALEKMK